MYSTRLPPIAAAAMASGFLVVFPMAENTTTGRRAWRARTMPATRVMAAAGRPADGVVAEHDEFVVENMAGAQASHEGGHTALALGVFARLRAVGLVHIDDGTRRRAGQVALLGHAAETFQRLAQISLARLRGEF